LFIVDDSPLLPKHARRLFLFARLGALAGLALAFLCASALSGVAQAAGRAPAACVAPR